MKKTFRRIVSLALALVMALSLAVSASAATEMTFDSLAEYGNAPTVVSSEVLIKMAYTTNVSNHGSLPTYITETPVTITSPEKNFCGLIELEPASNRNQPAYFIGSTLPINGTYTITTPGLYLLWDEPLTGGPIKMAMVLEVQEGTFAPEEDEDAVTGGIIESGLHNFYRVNTYKEGQYKDVPASHTFSENAKAGYEFGIMQGYGTTFGVSNNITRLASIITACRLHSIYEIGGNYIEANYTGTTKEIYMAYAKENGILCSFDDVSKPATRAEFAAILSSAFPDEALAAKNTVVDNAIPDVSMDTKYAADIYRLYRAGILNGSDAIGTFYPNSYINRGAACAIATRMCDEDLRKSVNLETDYETALSDTALEIAAVYLVATASFSYCTDELKNSLNTGNYSYNTDALTYYEDAIAALEYAAELCGSHGALKIVKDLTNESITILKAALPTTGKVNSYAYFVAMRDGMSNAIPPLQLALPVLEVLVK